MWYFLFLITSCIGESSIIPASQYHNIVVIPDMHGDAEALLLSLYSGYRELALSESELPVPFDEFRSRFDQVIETQKIHASSPLWNRKNVAVVQLGDLIDRGKFSLKCLLIMRAVRAVIGFEVFQILGNHELAPAIRVDSVYSQYRNPSDDLNWDAPSETIEKPDGILYGEITKRFLPIIRLDGGKNRGISTLFVHAGVPLEFIAQFNDPLPSNPNDLVRFLNLAIKSDLMSNRVSPSRLIKKYLSDDTIFSTREYKKKFPDCLEIQQILNLFQVSRIVVGHIADSRNHRARNVFCKGRPVVVLADIGSSRYMTGFDKDTDNPFPGSVLMRIDPTGHSLVSMEGIYVDIRGELVPNSTHSLVQIRSSQVPPNEIQRIGPEVYRDDFVKIGYLVSTSRIGLVLQFSSAGLARSQSALEQLDETRNVGLLSDMIPTFEIIEVNGQRVLFVDAKTEIPMTLYPHALTEDIVEQMEDFVNLLNDEEICLGIYRGATESQLNDPEFLRQRYLRLFFISRNGTSVSLVNFSQLHICDGAESVLESGLFLDAFAQELGI